MTPIEFLNSDECPNLKNGMGLNEIQISIISEIMQAYTDKQLRIGGVVSSSNMRKALETVVRGYEDDGMEGMKTRDKVFYKVCKEALELDETN